MLCCVEPELEQWRPDFLPSAQPSPRWTRLRCGGGELCNALESVEWRPNPVQTVLCGACGHPGCGDGGYAHVSRVGDHLWWTRPQVEPVDDWERGHYGACDVIEQAGSVLLPASSWDRIRQRVPGLPAADSFPPASYRTVLGAWLGEARLGRRVEEPGQLVRILRDHLVASDTMDGETARGIVEGLVTLAAERGEEPAAGRMVRAAEAGIGLETLYFDGPPFTGWTAFGRTGKGPCFAFGREWVLVPSKSRESR